MKIFVALITPTRCSLRQILEQCNFTWQVRVFALFDIVVGLIKIVSLRLLEFELFITFLTDLECHGDQNRLNVCSRVCPG